MLARVRRVDTLPLVAAAPVIAILGWWTFAGGGYAPTVWYPGAIALLVMIVLLAAVGALRWPRQPALLVAIGGFALYTVWSFLSVLWADSPGDAVEGSHRTLLYLVAFTLMALIPWTARALWIALGAWVAVVTAAAVVTTLALGGSDPVSQVIDARLSEPTGYMNADPALWTMAALPALLLGSRRETPLLLRPLFLTAAALLIELCLLSQSRGWLFTLPIVVAASLLLVPGRLRVSLFALPIGAAVALSATRLLEPFSVAGGRAPGAVAGPLREALNDAAAAAATGAIVALATAIVLVLIDRFVAHPERTRRFVRPISAVVLAVVILGGIGAAILATDGRPVQRIDRAWEDFKDFDEPGDRRGDARFSDLGSSRYDFWRVSAALIREQPMIGTGQDNFAEDYIQRRRSDEETRWTHSFELRLLTHTGIVGLVLMLTALAAIFAGGALLLRGRPDRVVAAAALLPATDWLLHGSLDWFWEYPALAGAALAFGAASAGLGAHLAAEPGPQARALGARARIAVAAPGALLVCVAAFWLTTAFLAERNADLGVQAFAGDRELALERFARARDLNPFGARAPLLEGLTAAGSGQLQRARSSLAEAASRSPRDWLVRFELGLLPNQPDSRSHLQAARRLNPKEPLITEAIRRLGSDRPMTQADAARVFRERLNKRFGRETAG